MLKNIRIVLVCTTHPGNIGAVARAMKTMGLSRLYLVSPERYPHVEATARASGADDVLAQAQVVGSLEEALVGCTLVFGASARQRTIAWPQVDPRQCAALATAEALTGEVAVVFGRERSGLTNDELERCHYLTNIPSNPAFPSLNIAAAVQVVTYELMMASLAAQPVVEGGDDNAAGEVPWATTEEMEQFYTHLWQTLVDIEFVDPAKPRLLARRLRRLFNRARLDKNEFNMLRGILAAAQAQTNIKRAKESSSILK